MAGSTRLVDSSTLGCQKERTRAHARMHIWMGISIGQVLRNAHSAVQHHIVFLVMAYREYMLGFARYAVDGVRRLGWSLPHGEVQYSRLGGG